MTYGETSTVKSDLGITGTAYDTQLADWNGKASQQWDDKLVIVGRKRNRITQLPELPLATAEVTEVDKDGTNHLMRARYYRSIKNYEAAKEEEEAAQRMVIDRIMALKEDGRIHGKIIR